MSRPLTRRSLLATSAAAITSRQGFTQSRLEQRVEIDTRTEIARIRPELHGHFAEHLGACTYGGLWVGANSPIPNINGHRKQAVEYLKQLGIPVLRWPGGCFADDYHWRDGIGPRAKRPKTVNLWWGMYTEDNSFGTHEFVELCRLIGAEPYLAGNVGSGTPQELRDWVEYCNYPSGSSLSDARAAHGSPEPFKVKYWGVGNENWGCGGRMTPEEYAGHYRRFANFAGPRGGIGGVPPYLIACGPSGNDTDWTQRFFAASPRGVSPQGFAMHFYQRYRQLATRYTPEQMREQFARFDDMERAIVQQRGLLDRHDPKRQIHLLVDEWGIWDNADAEEEKRYGRLWQQIPMRCATGAALGLNVFHRHADKVAMGNIAQIVNVIHSLLLTREEKCIRTPAYYAFELAKPHRGRLAVPARVSGTGSALSVSASRDGRELAVTLVNPLHDTPMTVECAVPGAKIAAAAARLLHHPDLNACNTFEQPDTIVPRSHSVQTAGERLKLELPPLGVCTVQAQLA
jgi:alpha-N-arabinofuranosidase